MHYIDIDTWERRGNYLYFKDFVNSWYSITTEIDLTHAKAAAKAKNESLFLYYLYAAVHGANQVKEMRTRLDNQDRVIQHDQVDIITPIGMPNGNFCTLRIPYAPSFRAFYDTASQLIASAPTLDNPYGAEEQLFEDGIYDVVHLSAVPKLYFTSVTFTANQLGRPCSWPLMTAGKTITREGRVIMPLAVYINHAFVDGNHLAAFVEAFQQTLEAIC